MNFKLFNSNKFIIFIVIILMMTLFVGIYYLILFPKTEKISLKESELATQEQILLTLQSKITETNTSTFNNSVALQQMIPVKPLLEKLILDIEKAEIMTNSFVANMNFGNADVSLPAQQNVEEKVDEEQESDTNASNTEEKKNPFRPTGVKKVTATLSVESPSYQELEEFIRILESSKRITVIESITFSAGKEIIDVDQSIDPLKYQISLSTYYMPTLSDLIDQLPKMETPEPANETNRFSSFGDITIDYEEPTDEYVEEEQSIPSVHGDVIEYTVKPGDTIYNLSIRFYNSNSGMQKIRDANGIVGNRIYVGETLKIPLD